jgi:TRAP-type mannitol/chloroaromatic compound transport system substrate-binding protein
MSTIWTPALDVLQGAALRLAKVVEEVTGGRFQIEVSSAGQTVHQEIKDSALRWFSTVPFGMNPEGMTAWHYQGEGLRLWEETYAAYNLVPRPGPAVAPQMAGWLRRPRAWRHRCQRIHRAA